MNRFYKYIIGIIFLLSITTKVSANEIPSEWLFSITLKHEFKDHILNLNKHPEFFIEEQRYYLRGQEILPDEQLFCSSEEDKISLPEGTEIKNEWRINLNAIEQYLENEVATKWNREPQNVRIFIEKPESDNETEKTKEESDDNEEVNTNQKNTDIDNDEEINEINPEEIKKPEGKIMFEGIGVFGEKLDIKASAKIIEKSIKENLSYTTLAVNKTNPEINVDSKELQNLGIKELIAIGESDFSGSPANRIHNIHVGASRFNGVLILKDEIFSFNKNLGNVTIASGFRNELVIKGDRTVPDVGGGLCQVSTTAFRTALLSGVEIVERWPHAYAVSYYTPWGSDATIYLGSKDLKFKNDTPGAMLIQTHIDGNNLFFHFYGTKDNRETTLFGPYTGRWISPPAGIKYEYTDTLAPGAKKSLSNSHSGFDATWFSLVKKENDPKPTLKKIFSRFQARGLFYLVGKEPEVAPERGPI